MLATPQQVKEIDLYKTTLDELKTFTAKLTFQNTQDLSVLHGFCIWFDVIFEVSHIHSVSGAAIKYFL